MTDALLSAQSQSQNKAATIVLYHMAVAVDELEKRVTFLFKLTPGAADKSYGSYIARIAGLPNALCLRAEQKAEEYQKAKHVRQ